MYWGLGESANICSAWIAVDDSLPDNGCMRYVSGSHMTRRVPHGKTDEGDTNMLSINQNISLDGEQEACIVDLPLKPGETSFHHGWVIHGSHANTSDRRRCGITCIYAPADLAPYVGDPESEKSMNSSVSATRETKVPWSEGYLVAGTAAGSHITALPQPVFAEEARM